MTILTAGAAVVGVTLATAATAVAQVKPPASLPGHDAYIRECAPCHGDDGKGDGPAAKTMLPRPRIFADNSNYKFRSTVVGALPTREDLMKVITEGIHGTAMPGFSALSLETRLNLVAYIENFSEDFADSDMLEDRKAVEIPNPPSLTAEMAAEGAELFKKYGCADCHGVQGRGDGPSWNQKKDDWGDPIVAANLTRWHQYRAGYDAKQIFKTTVTGVNPMPGFSRTDIPDDDRWKMVAWIQSIHQPKRSWDQVVIAKRMDELPATVDDDKWQTLPQAMFPLVAQIVQKPRLFWPSVTEVFVRAAYNDDELVLWLQWDDRDQSKGTNLTEYKPEADPATDIIVTSDHPDQLAIQFPTGEFSGDARPYFLLGDANHEVNLWWWISSSGFIERNAKGAKKIEDQDDENQEIQGQVAFQDGRYEMIVRRSLKTRNARDVQFEVGVFVPVAFNIWQGSRGEVGQRRAISSWQLIVLEPPIPTEAYIKPVVAVGFTLGILLLVVAAVRRKARAEAARPKPVVEPGAEPAFVPAPALAQEVEVEDSERVSGVGVVMVAAVAGLAIYIGVIGIQAVLTSMEESEIESSVKDNAAEVQKLLDKQREDLNKYELADPAKGEATVPVERAMDLVIEEANANAPSLVPSVGPHDKPTMPADMPAAGGDSALDDMPPAGDEGAVDGEVDEGGAAQPAPGGARPGAVRPGQPGEVTPVPPAGPAATRPGDPARANP